MQTFAKLSLAAVFASTLVGTLAKPLDTTLVNRAAAQVITQCTVPNTVAITFDDGPYDYIYDISKTLTDAGAKGQGDWGAIRPSFLTGITVRQMWNEFEAPPTNVFPVRCIYSAESQERIKFIYGQGHQVASHTWGHKDLSTLSWDQLHDEMWRVEQALQRIVGVTPAFMRPPFGSYNDNVRNVAGARGQKIANWDFDSRDAAGASAAESKQLYDEAIARRPSTILTLNHETHSTTAYEVLPYAIQKLQAAGYKLVTVAECLGEQPYQSVGSPGTPDASWTC